MIHPTKHISVSINVSPQKVYNFASRPENLSQWAAGLSRSTLKQSGDFWLADSPMGEVKVKFVPQNTFGILDHEVTLPSGEVNYNPFRIIPNGSGSEVIFTLFRLPRMSQEDFDRDAEMIKKDLEALKMILEKD